MVAGESLKRKITALLLGTFIAAGSAMPASAAPVRVQLPKYASGSLKFKSQKGKVRGAADLDQAWTKYEAGDDKGALELFNKVLAEEPTNPDALVGRALVKASLGDIDGAFDDLETCISHHEDYEPAWIVLALLDEALEYHLCSEASMNKARKLYEKSKNTTAVKAAKEKIAQLQAKKGAKIAVKVTKPMKVRSAQKTKSLVAQRKSKARIAKAAKTKQAKPNIEELFTQLETKLDAGDYKAAIELASKILEQGSDPWALLYRAIAKLELGEATAANDVVQLVDNYPDFPEGWILMGEILEASGDYVNALACYDEAGWIGYEMGWDDVVEIAAAHYDALEGKLIAASGATVAKKNGAKKTGSGTAKAPAGKAKLEAAGKR